MARITLAPVTVADKAVTSAGTRVALAATSTLVRQVVIQWHPSNVGNVYIGDSSVDSTHGLILNSSNPSISFSAEDSVADEDNCFFDLSTIYIDSVNSADAVKMLYFTVSDKSYNS